MPNWKNASDYKFTKLLTASGWAWEFMRRNDKYKADWKSASSIAVYDPPKKEGESDNVWRSRVIMADGQPRKLRLADALGRKWGMISAIQDPQDQQVPKFGLSFPIRVAYDEVLQYFEDEEPFYPRSEFPVLVFDLRRPLNSQMVIAKAELQKIQKSETLIKPKNISQKKWTTYLRLIDGEATGAMPKEIRKFIEAYHPKSNDPEDLKKATDAFSDHRKQAHALRDNPLAILPIDSPKFLGMKTGEDSQ